MHLSFLMNSKYIWTKKKEQNVGKIVRLINYELLVSGIRNNTFCMMKFIGLHVMHCRTQICITESVEGLNVELLSDKSEHFIVVFDKSMNTLEDSILSDRYIGLKKYLSQALCCFQLRHNRF